MSTRSTLDFTRGESNNDGNVDLSDAVLILGCKFLAACISDRMLPTPTMKGKDDISDPIFTLDFLFLGGPHRRRPAGQAPHSLWRVRRLKQAHGYEAGSSRYWARLIQRTWLVDPFLCGSCGQPMKVLAAISSPEQDDVIEKILRARGEWNPPWKRKRAPSGSG